MHLDDSLKQQLNQDEGYRMPHCWIATVKKKGEGLAGAPPQPLVRELKEP